MAGPIDFPTCGKVTEAKDGMIVFNPRGTTYALHLKCEGKPPPLDTWIDVWIGADARKIWTVPSGGNFVTPIVGTPRIVQGRVKYLSEREVVVQAGANFIIDFPSADSDVDLPDGPITIGKMVNVSLLPGASIELLGMPAGAGV